MLMDAAMLSLLTAGQAALPAPGGSLPSPATVFLKKTFKCVPHLTHLKELESLVPVGEI